MQSGQVRIITIRATLLKCVVTEQQRDDGVSGLPGGVSMYRIAWFVDDSGWALARQARHFISPSSYRDVLSSYLTVKLSCPVQFVYADERLFTSAARTAPWERGMDYAARVDLPEYNWGDAGPYGHHISLVDLAFQLHRIVTRHDLSRAEDGALFRYQESAGQHIIYFTKRKDSIEIRSSFERTGMLVVPVDEFLAGTETFLRQFAHSTFRRAPRLFDLVMMREMLCIGGDN